VPRYDLISRDFQSDRLFVNAIEKTVPAGSAILELPAMQYVISEPVNKLTDFQLFRGYLHSNSLRWSYGAMKSRDTDIWQRQTLSLPVDESLQVLRKNGFRGIYLDRRGFADHSTENFLNNKLPGKIISDDAHLVFFPL
jgi:phosphoglycerol transferase